MKITYTNKVQLNENPSVADINKCKASDLNEIKNVVNSNDDNVGDLTQLDTTDKTSIVNAINEENDKNNYSTDEVIIGKWLNGEPIYRKVVYVASLPNSSITNIPFSTRISALISIKGYATNNISYLPINGSRPDANPGSIGVQFSGYDTLSIITGQDRRSWNAYIILEYTKTTG